LFAVDGGDFLEARTASLEVFSIGNDDITLCQSLDIDLQLMALDCPTSRLGAEDFADSRFYVASNHVRVWGHKYTCSCQTFKMADTICRHMHVVSRHLLQDLVTTSRAGYYDDFVTLIANVYSGTKWFPFRGGEPTSIQSQTGRRGC
jgi:hypothetical protein